MPSEGNIKSPPCGWPGSGQPPDAALGFALPPDCRISVIIPALNEESSIGRVIAEIPPWVTEVIVADNGSTDSTAQVARAAGARVAIAREKGYGSACLAGIAMAEHSTIFVFLDGDYSDYPAQMGRLIKPIADGSQDMVLGSRVIGQRQFGAMLPQQRLGGALATFLIRLIWRHRFTDLGPFRAIDRRALTHLAMDDKNFGWTIQMQIRAIRAGMRVWEVPVDYRKRIGKSKISGTLWGVLRAGYKIILTIFREAARPSPSEYRPDAKAKSLSE